MCLRPRQIWTNQSTTWQTKISWIYTDTVTQFSPGIVSLWRRPSALRPHLSVLVTGDLKCVCVCTFSSGNRSPLCMSIFFIRSPPSQYSIAMHKLPASTWTKESAASSHVSHMTVELRGARTHSPWKEQMKATTFGCFIFDSRVTSFCDASFCLADIWGVKTRASSLNYDNKNWP